MALPKAMELVQELTVEAFTALVAEHDDLDILNADEVEELVEKRASFLVLGQRSIRGVRYYFVRPIVQTGQVVPMPDATQPIIG